MKSFVVSEVDYDDCRESDDVAILDRLLFASTSLYRCKKCSDLILFDGGNWTLNFFASTRRVESNRWRVPMLESGMRRYKAKSHGDNFEMTSFGF